MLFTGDTLLIRSIEGGGVGRDLLKGGEGEGGGGGCAYSGRLIKSGNDDYRGEA